jgi:hypothetical protein
MRLALLCVPAVLALGACASSEPPLVCDEARAGEVAFLFQESAAWHAPYQPHGAVMLAIDGSCRYHVVARAGVRGSMRTGSLTEDELVALNAELLTFDWASVDGLRVESIVGADAPTVTMRRGASASDVSPPLEAECYADCSAHDALRALEQRSRSWAAQLWERGVPLEGPVEVDGQALEPWREPPPGAIAWTGEAELATLLPGPGYMFARVADPDDAALLRALRDEAPPVCCGPPLFLEQGGAFFAVGIADVPPLDLALPVHRTQPW